MNERGDELQSLCESAIEGLLTAEEAARLERLVIDDREARRFYVEYLNQHACLRWSVAEPAFLAAQSVAGAAVTEQRATACGTRPGGQRPTVDAVVGGARWLPRPFPCWASGWACGRGRGGQVPLSLVARPSSETIGCKWGSGSLPTETGARLPAGRVRLVEGLARISFADGAEVQLLRSPSRPRTRITQPLHSAVRTSCRQGADQGYRLYRGHPNRRHQGSGNPIRRKCA